MSINVKKNSKTWVVYILRCCDGSLYTGITNNIEKRLAAHHQGKAAKYTRSRRPVELLVTGTAMESSAMRLEIKSKDSPKTKSVRPEKHAPRKSSTAATTSKRRVVAGKSTPFRQRNTESRGRPVAGSLKIHRKIPVQGSPERSAFRVVLEDTDKDSSSWNKLHRNRRLEENRLRQFSICWPRRNSLKSIPI